MFPRTALERVPEAQRVRSRTVIAGKVPGPEPHLAAILNHHPGAARLHADQQHILLGGADPGRGAVDVLIAAAHDREMQIIALLAGDLAEEGAFGHGLAVELDKNVADRVLPVIEPPASGNAGGRRDRSHRALPGSRRT